jgi:hypothetical protein
MSTLLHQLQIDQPAKYKQAIDYGKLIIKNAKASDLTSFQQLWEKCPFKEYMDWYISQAFRIILTQFNTAFVNYFIDAIKPDFKNNLYLGTTHYFIWNCRERLLKPDGPECAIMSRLLDIFDKDECEYANRNTPLHVAFQISQPLLIKLLLSKEISRARR